MANYRKKPVIVQAEQFYPDKEPWPAGVCTAWLCKDGLVYRRRWADSVQCHAIETLEGWHVVSPGDWIITGVKGEKYPCKPDVFDATYEQAAPWVPTNDS